MTPKEFLLSLGFTEEGMEVKKHLPDGRLASLQDILEMYVHDTNVVDSKLTLPLDIPV